MSIYLQTIESDKSLVKLSQNTNHSNVFLTNELIFKDFYYNFFNEFSAKTSNYSFLKTWYKLCDDYEVKIKNFLEIAYTGISNDSKEKIWTKFKGNVAEILFEALIKFGKLNNYLTNEYTPVDPSREEYIDGIGINPNTGMYVGVQIKNYSQYNHVSREIFDKSYVMSGRFRERFNNADYNEKVCQIIISFSDVSDTRLINEPMSQNGFKNKIIFFGPAQINSLYLGGHSKFHIEPAKYIFQSICEKISNL